MLLPLLLLSDGHLRAQWIRVPYWGNRVIEVLAAGPGKPGTLFARVDSIFRSTNSGMSWMPVNRGLKYRPITSLVASSVDSGKLYVGSGWYDFFSSTGGAYHSTNNGDEWLPLGLWGCVKLVATNPLVSGQLFALQIHGGGADRELKISTNNGATWRVSLSLNSHNITSIAYRGTRIFLGCDGYFLRSADDGTGWLFAMNGLTNGPIHCLATLDGSIFAGTADGVYRTSDDGENWVSAGLDLFHEVISLLPGPAGSGSLFAGLDGNGVFLSTDHGITWNDVGLEQEQILSLALSGTYLFAGTRNGMWRRPVSQMLTPVYREENHPDKFILEPNHPNPFSVGTIISFNLPVRSYVRMRLIDNLGREIAIPLNEERAPGRHEIPFEASNLPGGIYFIRLEAGGRSVMGKMTVVK